MKNTLLISLLLLATFESFGQSYTYIPDTAFEQALINQGYDDTLDGRILTSAAATVTRLVMPDQNPKITDITGIEAFINLEYFDAIDNSIVVLDFTKNKKLQEIRCWHNNPTERTVEMLDVTGLTDLTYVGLDNNLIRVCDFSTNSALEIVGIQNNELTSLKFHPNANLSFLRLADNDLITHIDLSNNDTNLNTFRAVNNPNLSCIRVSDLNNAQTNSGWDEDAISVYATTACPEEAYTVIPDQNFEQALIDLGIDSNPTKDGRILTSAITTLENLDLNNKEISDLTGIQNFTNLKALNASENNLRFIYLSKNTKLEELVVNANNLLAVNLIFQNQLTTFNGTNNSCKSINLSNPTAIEELRLSNNKLFGGFDLSSFTKLRVLALENNEITKIKLPNITSINEFSIGGNAGLNSLDISGIDTNLNTFQATNLTALNCIQVSDVTHANNQNGWQKDTTTNYSENCGGQPFTVTPTITGDVTGMTPNFEITEGQAFNINFNADTTAPNGTNYTPSISITQAGVPDASGDFTITDINQPITVSANNPDGSIQLTPKDDGNNTGDEVYTITIASENTDIYTIAEPVSFTVRVKDQVANTPFEIKTGVQLYINGYDISETKLLTPPFRVKEGQNFRVYHSIEVTFDAEGILNSDLAEYTVDIKTKEGTADSKDFTGITQNDFVIKNNENDIDATLYGIRLEIDTIIEQDEDFFIEITPKQPNIRFRDLEGNLLNAGETLTIPITIIESYIYGDRVRFEASLEGDVTESEGEYYVDEGGKIEVVFKSLETIADGFEFNVPFSVYGEEEDVDYNIESENPLIKIDNSQPNDGILVVNVLNDNENEVDETIGITLNQLMDNNYHADFINGAPEISFTINVNNKATNQIAAVLSNTGGMESSSNNVEDQRFDIITLSLLDFKGNPYNTGQTLEFNIEYTTQGLTQPAEDGDFIPERKKFVIKAGTSTDSIKVVYPKEQDLNDKEADYYNVTIVQDKKIPQNISLPNPLRVEILDNEEPFQFSIKFVGDADLVDNGSPDCCIYRRVEENSILKFEISAEKGVPVGMEYIVNIEDSNKVFTGGGVTDAIKDIDYKLISFQGKKEAKFTSNGNNNEADGTWICGILDNLEDTPKQFNLSFKAWIIDPNTEEKVPLPGGRSYDFTIIKANPVNVTLDGNNTINEDDEENNSTQIRVFYEGAPGGDYNVDFELSGSVSEDDFKLSASTKINYNYTKGTGNIELKKNPEGVYEAFITVTALNEAKGKEVNEDDEKLTITLVDGFGYKVGNSNFQTITITDEDRADHYAAIHNVSKNTNIYEKPAANQSNRAVLEVFLQDEAGNSLDAEEDVSIHFAPNAGNNGQPELNKDYKIYLGKDEDLKDINTDSMVITILKGESSGYLTLEAIDDETEENENETITMALTTGIGYNIGSQKETAVTIISDERGNEFDPSQISATVSNPTCPGFDEGGIVIANNSQFDFVAELHPTDPNIPAQELPQDSKISFQGLKLGEYEIRLKAPENLEGIPPSFKLNIRNTLQPTTLLATSKQPSAKTARLTVSGAKRYKAWVNGQAHSFEFDDRQIHQLQLPLENGQNQIVIDGETPCQGQIKTTLYLANYQVYPNPTENTVTLSGLVAQTNTHVNLFSAEGQLALSFEGVSSNSGFLEIDVSILPPGMYFGKVSNEQQELFQIKLLKN
jgi:hypothetical protein